MHGRVLPACYGTRTAASVAACRAQLPADAHSPTALLARAGWEGEEGTEVLCCPAAALRKQV